MYVACRDLVTVKGKRQAGDDLPEAMDWSEAVLKNHLNLGWIKQVERASAKAKAPTTRTEATTVETVVVKETSKERSKEPSKDAVKCTSCERTFPDKRRMKIHVAQAHKVT